MGCRDRCGNYGLELILVFFGIFMTIGFLVTYIAAVCQGHVDPYLPYISNTGGTPPESCVFSFVCGVGTLLILVIVCLRYKHLHHYYHSTVPWMHCINVFSGVVGLLSALGLFIVGSFQNTNARYVHFTGAVIVFGGGVLYFWLQSVITIGLWRSRLTPYVGCCLILTRLVISLLASGLFVIAIAGGFFGSHDHDKAKEMLESLTDSQMYLFHIVSAAAEWLLGFSFAFFFLTFHPDFSRISLDFGVKLKHHHHTDISHRHSIISTDSETTPLMI